MSGLLVHYAPLKIGAPNTPERLWTVPSTFSRLTTLLTDKRHSCQSSVGWPEATSSSLCQSDTAMQECHMGFNQMNTESYCVCPSSLQTNSQSIKPPLKRVRSVRKNRTALKTF
ncbi:hypothetical protein F2P81_003775 [Scophthalmus maximus]|uniref:Uncharacterized protein n=1 Tax=Scophthalmus maximus TaxID=52904 RepID=A0A6A4TDI4_SCOMX|nr:hypothetical protein F2P81_003775 [Scophthalmus maximus]